jgi:hypothetical protein
VAIDGSKFKAVNNRDRNFTRAKMKRRIAEANDEHYRHKTSHPGDRGIESPFLLSKLR